MIKKCLSIGLACCFLAVPSCLSYGKTQGKSDSQPAQEELTKELLKGVAERAGEGKKTADDWKVAAFNKLPRAVRLICRKQLVPALESESGIPLLNAVQSLVLKHPPATVAAVEDYCRSIGHGVLSERVSAEIINLINQRAPVQTKTWKPIFTQYIAAGLIESINSEMSDLNKHQLMQDPLELPADWREADQLFWEVHVWKNRFLNLDQVVRATNGLNQQLLDAAKKAEDENLVGEITKRMMIGIAVREKFEEMLQREAELRLVALSKAEEILRKKTSFKDRLNAAFALELHAGELTQFFQAHKPEELKREKLKDPTIIDQGKQLVASGREHGKDVIEKALLLRVGAHWWLRGRYGSSSLAHGLLKPESAVQNQDVMFGLFMPKKRPKAIGDVDSETGKLSPGYDRRHYFTWAVERRDAFLDQSSYDGPSNSQTQTVGTASDRFY
ncbi:MAG: hypothetical protein AB8B55_13845 [Mariniblastus sp.]